MNNENLYTQRCLITKVLIKQGAYKAQQHSPE